MKSNLHNYNATSRLKAAAIAAANAVDNSTPEATYHIALLYESNALQPDEEAINNLANAAVDWFAAYISYVHAVQGLLENYPPANEALEQMDPVIMEYSSKVVFMDELNLAEIRPLSPYITQCAATMRNYVEAIQAVIGNALAANAAYIDALKRENEARADTDSAMERLEAAQAKHDIAEMDKSIKAFAAVALRYTGLAIKLVTATLPTDNSDEAV